MSALEIGIFTVLRSPFFKVSAYLCNSFTFPFSRVMQAQMSHAFLPQQAAMCHSPLGSLTSAGVEALMTAQAASASSHLSQMEAVLNENEKLQMENEKLQRENEMLRRELESYGEKANRIQKVKEQVAPFART